MFEDYLFKKFQRPTEYSRDKQAHKIEQIKSTICIGSMLLLFSTWLTTIILINL